MIDSMTNIWYFIFGAVAVVLTIICGCYLWYLFAEGEQKRQRLTSYPRNSRRNNHETRQQRMPLAEDYIEQHSYPPVTSAYPPQSSQIGFRYINEEAQDNRAPYPLDDGPLSNRMPQPCFNTAPYPLTNPHSTVNNSLPESANRMPRVCADSRPYPLEDPHPSTSGFAPPPSYEEVVAGKQDFSNINLIKRQRST